MIEQPLMFSVSVYVLHENADVCGRETKKKIAYVFVSVKSSLSALSASSWGVPARAGCLVELIFPRKYSDSVVVECGNLCMLEPCSWHTFLVHFKVLCCPEVSLSSYRANISIAMKTHYTVYIYSIYTVWLNNWTTHLALSLITFLLDLLKTRAVFYYSQFEHCTWFWKQQFFSQTQKRNSSK